MEPTTIDPSAPYIPGMEFGQPAESPSIEQYLPQMQPSAAQGFDPNAQAVDPGVLKVAQELLGQYGSYEGMQAALAQQDIAAKAEEAKAAAEQAVNAQFAGAIQSLKHLEAQVAEGMIEQSVYEAQESALRTAYNATLAQAKQFAEMQPQLQAFQAAQAQAQEKAKVAGQVNAIVQSNPSLRGAEGLLEVQIRQGIDPTAAANAILGLTLNRNAVNGYVPAPRVPASLPMQSQGYGQRNPMPPSVVNPDGTINQEAVKINEQLFARLQQSS